MPRIPVEILAADIIRTQMVHQNLTRCRISEKTIRRIIKRPKLRNRMFAAIQDELEDMGIMCIQLERGGFGLVMASALHGAPVLAIKPKSNPNRVWLIKYQQGDMGFVSDKETRIMGPSKKIVEAAFHKGYGPDTVLLSIEEVTS